MPGPIDRIVDAHVHLWDPARADWYPYLAGQRELGMGDISGMCRLFDQPTYFAESAGWNVVKFVHVAARFTARVRVADARRDMDGKSILGILLLAAARGSTLTISADGADEGAAIEALASLVASGFGEGACGV